MLIAFLTTPRRRRWLIALFAVSLAAGLALRVLVPR